MSAILHLDARVTGEAAERPTPTPKTPANHGSGDVRKGIVPVVKPIQLPVPAVKPAEVLPQIE